MKFLHGERENFEVGSWNNFLEAVVFFLPIWDIANCAKNIADSFPSFHWGRSVNAAVETFKIPCSVLAVFICACDRFDQKVTKFQVCVCVCGGG